MNDFAETLKKIGVKIIAISQIGNNTLSRLSHVNIQFYTRVITNLKRDLEVCANSQFFIVSEFLALKYLQYKGIQK